ncbi:sentrin-specific protease 7 isoform X1 [Sarcophilus harrisii]|uniref:Sentrin-specific protease 7 n=3 Tax=Sarcophilus harrisii TaxID=9305 RepID=G3W630_SARHA|nr:sentrin-specific protease 7 isoform X1 [Sarcophilus harrisii]
MERKTRSSRSGGRRFLPETIIEGKMKKPSSSNSCEFRIPKKSKSKQEDTQIQIPLSRLRSSDRWDHPLKGWIKGGGNKGSSSFLHKSKKDFHGCTLTSRPSPNRQLKVMLTNVLLTDSGRKYIKNLPRTDANLCDTKKLQSDSLPSTSVDSLAIHKKLNPLHQSLYLSERQPKVILMNVLGTELGRKYIKTLPLTETNLCETDNMQSNQLPSSSVDNLKSCQKLEPHKSPFLPERCSQSQKNPSDSFAKQGELTKEKERSNDSSLARWSDTEPKDFNRGNRDHDHQEEESRNQEDTYSNSKVVPYSTTKKTKKRHRSHVLEYSNVPSLEESTLQSKEQERDSLPSECGDPNENDYLHDLKALQGNTLETVEIGFMKSPSFETQEVIVGCAQNSFSDSSATGTFQNLNPICSDALEISSIVDNVSMLVTEAEVPVLRKLRSRKYEEKQLFVSVEPIVVSSDEEGPFEQNNSDTLNLQPEQDYELVIKDEEGVSELDLSEETLMTASKSSQVSPNVFPGSLVMDNFSCIIPSDEVDLHLDITFTSIYIGSIRGVSSGYVTFTTKYIKIPFQVSLNKISLLVDTIHLKKFGLWTHKDDNHCKRRNSIIFLWTSSDYLEMIENQLGKSVLRQLSKSDEFIFLELSKPASEEEEDKLNEVMAEVSRKTRSLDLCHPLPWNQALSLLQGLSAKESSFIDYYCSSKYCHNPVPAVETKAESPPQASNANITKPSYTLLQKRGSGCYSLSITSNPDDNEWKEVKNTGPIKKLIVYPPPPTKGGLGVTNEDLECLEDGEFLNDVIIDFYLKYLILEKASDELVERSHIFSSFFYKCLTRKENNSIEENPNLSMAQRRHKRVRTWTRHINIFNKDYIFVPVNEASHWYLAVICFPWLEGPVYEDFPHQSSQQSKSHNFETPLDNDLHITSSLSLDTEDPQGTLKTTPESKKMCKRPCILILDSLKAGSVQNTVQILREYLEVEWEVRRKTHREFSKTNMVDLCPKVPKQDNSSDCGVYLLQYVESFFKDPIVNFELPLHLEKWFPRQVIRAKRDDIRELILKLHLQQQKGNNS